MNMENRSKNFQLFHAFMHNLHWATVSPHGAHNTDSLSKLIIDFTTMGKHFQEQSRNIGMSINIALMPMTYLKHLSLWVLLTSMTEQYNTQFTKN